MSIVSTMTTLAKRQAERGDSVHTWTPLGLGELM